MVLLLRDVLALELDLVSNGNNHIEICATEIGSF